VTSGTVRRAARVLVVDDEPLVADAIRLVLNDEFDVATTTDPAQALVWLTSDTWYDVILCDVMMPKMNGVELRNRVHAKNPALAARIIFVTGGILMASVHALLEGVPNLVLAKPFDFASLRDLIRRRTLAATSTKAGPA
jgi:CheY-like chemotaxis protein